MIKSRKLRWPENVARMQICKRVLENVKGQTYRKNTRKTQRYMGGQYHNQSYWKEYQYQKF